jgi:hypothetical protein
MLKTLSQRVLSLALLAVCLGAFAADDPKPRKDAAEAVQEGNVQNWVEYYQRTRPPPSDRPVQPVNEPAAPQPKDSVETPRR